jgi:DNA-directed RNA polymerase specialized sigma24 family protein
MVERHEVQRQLREAIAGLPPRMRPVVLLRSIDQLSFSEIGQQLKIPTTAAKSYFYRALPLLHATLTGQGPMDPPAEESAGSQLS